MTLRADEGSNEIWAGFATVTDKDGVEHYVGKGKSVDAYDGAAVSLNARTNSFYGGLVAGLSNKTEKSSSITVTGTQNYVSSYSVLQNAGDLEDDEQQSFKDVSVISALYAEGVGTEIVLTGRNYLNTYAEYDNKQQLERVIWAYDGANVTVNGFSAISTDSYVKSPNSLDVAIAAGTAVNLTPTKVNEAVDNRAIVNINYQNEGSTKSAISGDILAAYAGEVNIKSNVSSEIARSESAAGIDIQGNLLAGNNGILNVDLGTRGTLTGRADDYGDAGVISEEGHSTSEFFDQAFSSAIYKGGEVNLSMGAGSRWYVTGQSWVTRITGSDEAIGNNTPVIDLISANTDRNKAAHALTVYELSGNAIFNMSLDADRDISDMLYIKNAQGEYLINVIDPVSHEDMYAEGFDGLRFATVGSGSKVKFRAITYDQGVNNVEYEIDTDAYADNKENHYYNGNSIDVTNEKPGSNLVDGFFATNGEPGAQTPATNDVMLLDDEGSTSDQSDTTEEETASTIVDETTNFKLVGRVGQSTSDAGKTIINMSRANYANAVYLDTLNKRQGEMRFSAGKDDGLWARVRYDRIGKDGSFDIDNTMMEIGIDSLSRKDKGEFHTGIALDYMTGDTDYHGVTGDGNIDRYGAWFYTTWLGDEGEYYDFVVKYGHLENDFEIYAPTTGEKITGDYDNEVLSASLEYGKKYQNEKRWYFEPQAQIQYAYVTSDDYVTSQGSEVRLDAIHSLIGRVGVRLGKDFETEKPMTFYVRGDIMHEFLGDQDIYASDATGKLHELYENEGTWYSAGAGFSFKTSDDLYMFLEAEKVFGNSYSGTYTLSGGVKYFF